MIRIQKLEYAIKRIESKLETLTTEIDAHKRVVAHNDKLDRPTDSWRLEEIEENERLVSECTNILKQLKNNYSAEFNALINELINQR